MRDDAIAGACLIGATASENQKRSLVGACLVGPTSSQAADRRVVAGCILVRQVKRTFLADDVPTSAMYESHLLRHCMQSVCDAYDQPVLFISYADPAAVDSRTGRPLGGWCYLAAGFFHAGETTSQRWCVVDHLGRARSTRQGSVTLSRRRLPRAGEIFHGEVVTADWRMTKLPPARIWLAVVTPRGLSRRRAKLAWRNAMAALHPRLAAKMWISHAGWRRMQRIGVVSLGAPRPAQMHAHERFQPAWWPGHLLTRTAAPVWVPMVYQQRTLLLADVDGERTGGRRYEPLAALPDDAVVGGVVHSP